MVYIASSINKEKDYRIWHCDTFALMTYSWLCIHHLFDSKYILCQINVIRNKNSIYNLPLRKNVSY